MNGYRAKALTARPPSTILTSVKYLSSSTRHEGKWGAFQGGATERLREPRRSQRRRRSRKNGRSRDGKGLPEAGVDVVEHGSDDLPHGLAFVAAQRLTQKRGFAARL